MATQEAPTYTEDNMVTAMCLWETFMEMVARRADEAADDAAASDDVEPDATASDADATDGAGALFDDHGSFTIRSALIALVQPCEDGWAAHRAGDAGGADGEQFDWDWCPRFLRGAMADGSMEAAIEAQYRA